MASRTSNLELAYVQLLYVGLQRLECCIQSVSTTTVPAVTATAAAACGTGVPVAVGGLAVKPYLGRPCLI